MTQKFKLVFGWIENLLGKGENIFFFSIVFFSQKCFQKPSSSWTVKILDCLVKSYKPIFLMLAKPTGNLDSMVNSNYFKQGIKIIQWVISKLVLVLSVGCQCWCLPRPPNTMTGVDTKCKHWCQHQCLFNTGFLWMVLN